MDPGFQRLFQIVGGLANPGVNDAAGRNPGPDRHLHFPDRHHVGPAAQRAQRAQHRLIAVRLHRKADRAVHLGQRVAEDGVVPFQRRRRIDIERGADRFGNLGQGDVFGVQHAIPVIKMMHDSR